MPTRPNLVSLPHLQSPTTGTTLIVVQDAGADLYITIPQAQELILGYTQVGPQGYQGRQGAQGVQGAQGAQ